MEEKKVNIVIEKEWIRKLKNIVREDYGEAGDVSDDIQGMIFSYDQMAQKEMKLVSFVLRNFIERDEYNKLLDILDRYLSDLKL